MSDTPGKVPALKPSTLSQRRGRAVILAGGDGTRLRPLTREITGDERPKQFCPIYGRETLLEQTRHRVGLSFPPENISVVVTRPHEAYYAPLLNDYRADSVVVQPENRGTTPAILYALSRLSENDPDCAVAFFPSDHFVSDDRVFMNHVDRAIEAIGRNPDSIVLLGIRPETPEVEYGWIEPGAPISPGAPALTRVRRFWEKPSQAVAEMLMGRGCLWNSFVMAGTVSGFNRLIQKAAPLYHSLFAAIKGRIGTPKETEVVVRLYRRIADGNFSEQVLTRRSADLTLLRVSGVAWSDLGDPRRALTLALGKQDHPDWIDQYSLNSAALPTA